MILLTFPIETSLRSVPCRDARRCLNSYRRLTTSVVKTNGDFSAPGWLEYTEPSRQTVKRQPVKCVRRGEIRRSASPDKRTDTHNVIRESPTTSPPGKPINGQRGHLHTHYLCLANGHSCLGADPLACLPLCSWAANCRLEHTVFFVFNMPPRLATNFPGAILVADCVIYERVDWHDVVVIRLVVWANHRIGYIRK